MSTPPIPPVPPTPPTPPTPPSPQYPPASANSPAPTSPLQYQNPLHALPPSGPYGTYDPYAATRPTSPWCRAAAIFQIVIGSLIALMAFCMLAAGAMVASGDFPAEQLSRVESVTQLHGAMHILFLSVGACLAVAAIGYIILGIFVWRRSLAASITAMVLTSVLLLLNLLNLAGSMLRPETRTAQTLCITGLGTLVLSALLGTVIMALREIRRSRTAPQTAYQQQWQQYYQAYYQAVAAQQPVTPLGPSVPPAPPTPMPPQQQTPPNQL